jgi:hypothetical protein
MRRPRNRDVTEDDYHRRRDLSERSITEILLFFLGLAAYVGMYAFLTGYKFHRYIMRKVAVIYVSIDSEPSPKFLLTEDAVEEFAASRSFSGDNVAHPSAVRCSEHSNCVIRSGSAVCIELTLNRYNWGWIEVNKYCQSVDIDSVIDSSSGEYICHWYFETCRI